MSIYDVTKTLANDVQDVTVVIRLLQVGNSYDTHRFLVLETDVIASIIYGMAVDSGSIFVYYKGGH